jgi:DNA-binding NtrC family response regulator
MRKHVLVVDDEECIRSILSDGLCRAGFLVTTANDAREALTLLVEGGEARAPVDLLLTDHNMPILTGLDLVDALKIAGVELPCFLMSGNLKETLAVEALSRGCAGFIEKPFKLPELVGHLCEALEVQPEWSPVQHWGT